MEGRGSHLKRRVAVREFRTELSSNLQHYTVERLRQLIKIGTDRIVQHENQRPVIMLPYCRKNFRQILAVRIQSRRHVRIEAKLEVDRRRTLAQNEQQIVGADAQSDKVNVLIIDELRYGEILLRAAVVRVQADRRFEWRLTLGSKAVTAIIRRTRYPETAAGFAGTGRIDFFFRLKQMLICRKRLGVANEAVRRGTGWPRLVGRRVGSKP